MSEIDVLSNVAPRGVREHDYQTRNDTWGFKPPVAKSEDLRRILALPRRGQELDGTDRAEAIIDMMTERFAKNVKKCSCAQLDPERECVTRLRLVQALALREIGICGGLLGPIGVGHGKTLIDLLAAWALAEVGIKLSVLLVPANLMSQLAADYEFVGQHFRMPSIVYHRPGLESQTVPGAPLVHVVPYSRLSHPDFTDWLENRLAPEAIIADECHRLRDVVNGAGASRVDRYMRDHPKTKFVGMSGSITAKSLSDYDHMGRWALRGGSPLPLVEEVTDDWCRALDPSENPADPGPLMELCSPGESIISGFRRRLAETVGVVTTTAPAVDCELRIEERVPPPVPKLVQDALDSIRAYLRPDGEELVDALSMSKSAREAACGFYGKWIFPHNVFPRDEELVTEWLEARKEWHKEQRTKLRQRMDHLDSPILTQHAAERAWGDRPTKRGLPVWKAETWPRWRDVKYKVKPETQAVWLDDFLVYDAIRWATEHRGIVWYEHVPFGERMAELSSLRLHGGGPKAPAAIKAERGDQSIICSIKAHGTGRDGLQRIFHEQLIVALPPAQGCEQVLGRLHRIGQKATSVNTWFYMHTDELENHVDAQLRAALYVEGTLGSVQKLRMGFKLK